MPGYDLMYFIFAVFIAIIVVAIIYLRHNE